MPTRPKLQLQPSPLDKRLETIGTILLVAMWLLAVLIFFKLPTTIPLHFNAAGRVDRYGNKAELFLLAVIATITYIGLTVLNNRPHIFNYPVTITEDNAQKHYATATRMLRYVKLVILALFTLIVLLTYFVATGKLTSLGPLFIPLLIGGFSIPVIVSLTQFKNQKKGE